MSESVTSKILKPAVNVAVDQLERTADSAIAILDATQNAVTESVGQVVDIGDKTADMAMAEIKEAKNRLADLIKAYADALLNAAP